MSVLCPDVATMLAAQGIAGVETPFAHDGYSGATMARIEHNGHRYVIKRVSRTLDWIIQMTSDHAMREAQIAASSVLEPLAPGIRSPSISAAYDGDGFALLMHDLQPWLLPPQGVQSVHLWNLVLSRVAQMHAMFWQAPPEEDLGWCDLRERLLMLSEPAGQRLRAAGMMEFGFASGWERFHEEVKPEVSVLVRDLHDDPAPLLNACDLLPSTLLHNDLKLANIAVEGETLWLFDWALSGIGPVGCDLGWLLCVNSSRMPWTLDNALERYAAHLRTALRSRFDEPAWERQCAVAYVSGLVMFGWAKADSRDELDWWCERALAARPVLRL
jgi:hypothetical protein